MAERRPTAEEKRYVERVFTCREKYATEVDETRAVQVEGLDGGPATWRQPDHLRAINTPAEVLAPALPAWVEERGHLPGDRVGAFGFRVLVVVAPLAGEGQVLDGPAAFAAPRLDVLDRKGLHREADLAAAVLAAALRPLLAEAVQGSEGEKG